MPASKTKKQSHRREIHNDTAQLNEYTPKSWMRGESIQVAYTIGGVSLKYAQANYDNTAYGFDTKAPKENRIVAVSLAF